MIIYLEGSSQSDNGVDLSVVLCNGVDDEKNVEDGQTHHREPEGLKLQVGASEVGVELTTVEEVDDRVSGVALRVDVRLFAAEKLGGNGSDG